MLDPLHAITARPRFYAHEYYSDASDYTDDDVPKEILYSQAYISDSLSGVAKRTQSKQRIKDLGEKLYGKSTNFTRQEADKIIEKLKNRTTIKYDANRSAIVNELSEKYTTDRPRIYTVANKLCGAEYDLTNPEHFAKVDQYLNGWRYSYLRASKEMKSNVGQTKALCLHMFKKVIGLSVDEYEELISRIKEGQK